MLTYFVLKMKEYLVKVQNQCEGVSNHAGAALASESMLRNAGLNSTSAVLENATRDKRPDCVKKDLSQLSAGLVFKNNYIGKVRSLHYKLKD